MGCSLLTQILFTLITTEKRYEEIMSKILDIYKLVAKHLAKSNF
jgi:hypothetical protein